MSLKLQSFGPIADKHSRVLVLGTMPGAMSPAKRQYYGHPRNAFWPIMARLCDRELPEDYALRKAMLLDAGIARGTSAESASGKEASTATSATRSRTA